MLIITVESSAAKVNFRLDGPLAGAAVGELARSWLAKAFDGPQQRVSLDLSGVTSIDVEGKAFLAQAYRHGNSLLGGVATKAIVDEIQATSATDSRSLATMSRIICDGRLTRPPTAAIIPAR